MPITKLPNTTATEMHVNILCGVCTSFEPAIGMTRTILSHMCPDVIRHSSGLICFAAQAKAHSLETNTM